MPLQTLYGEVRVKEELGYVNSTRMHCGAPHDLINQLAKKLVISLAISLAGRVNA